MNAAYSRATSPSVGLRPYSMASWRVMLARRSGEMSESLATGLTRRGLVAADSRAAGTGRPSCGYQPAPACDRGWPPGSRRGRSRRHSAPWPATGADRRFLRRASARGIFPPLPTLVIVVVGRAEQGGIPSWSECRMLGGEGFPL